jgi:hypothetical protein
MRVTSPIGDYPYEIRKIRARGGRLVVEGGLGMWDTTFEIEPGDWVALARRAAAPLALAAGAVLATRALLSSRDS